MSNNLNQLSRAQRAYLAQRLLDKGKIEHKKQRIIRYPRNGATPSFPLSFGQERLWLLNRLEQESAAYNIAIGFKITGTLDLPILTQAVKRLVQQQEILRTVFCEEDGQPRQMILPDMDIPVEEIDLSGIDEANQAGETEEIVKREKSRLFNLERGPLLRLVVITLQTGMHILVIHMHHIISDAWSLRFFANKIFELYDLLYHGQIIDPDPLPIQYADYAIWQRESLDPVKLTELSAFWKSKLDGAPFVFDMPLDFPRPAFQTFEGGIYRFELGETLSRKLQSFGGSVSLYIKLLTLFNILLYRYTGQHDILIGSPVWNRSVKETENLIGFFINTLVFRNTISTGDNFTTLLAKVKTEALAVYEYMDMPFEQLVKIIRLERDFSRNPIFQISLNVYNQSQHKKQYTGWEADVISLTQSSSVFDLTLNVRVRDEKLIIWFEYNKSLFLPETIERLAQYFCNLTAGVFEQPETPIQQLDYLPSGEKSLLLDLWNRTDKIYPPAQSAQELITRQTARTPEALAVISWKEAGEGAGSQSLRYTELDAQANQFCRYLQSLGICSGSAVGIFMQKTADTLIVLLGILKSGAYYVPLDPSYPAERLAYIVADSGLQVIIRSKEQEQPLFQGVHMIEWETERDLIRQLPAVPVTGTSTPDEIAYCIYTSGSTGNPKGVQVPHKALVNFLYAMQDYAFIRENERLLSVTPLSFDISILELLLPLTVGAATVVIPQSLASDPGALLRVFRQQQPHTMQATPATWQMLLESGFEGHSSMTLLCGGEALSGELAGKLLNKCGSLWNMYGPTETTIWSCVHQVTRSEKACIPIGRPIANTEIYILDHSLQPVPVGAIGHLYIGGKGLANGYHRLPELTTQRFIPNPFSMLPGARLYQTGDLARYRPDGAIEYHGRSDFQVKVRGFRIELGEIEAVLQQHPGVNQAVAIVHGDNEEDKAIVAYTIPREKGMATGSDLKLHLEKKLPAYMIPHHFVELASFPLTPNGKIDRRALRQQNNFKKSGLVEYVAPSNEIEAILADIWQEIFKRDKIGINDNFFLLGGHSLLAVKALARIRNSFEIELPLRVFFQAPIIKTLAQKVEAIIVEELARMDEAEPQARSQSPGTKSN